MMAGWGRLLAFAMLVSACGCDGTGPFGPIDPGEVSITLSVSGGFVGRDLRFRVDGDRREVVGVSCRAFCDFDAGEVILPISGAQVEALARRLELADVFALGGDYGTACCDQFHYDLTYERDGRSVRVQGSDQEIPEALRAAIAQVAVLADRRVPMLVAPESGLPDWPRDAYTLGEVTVQGRVLTATVTYGGGCAAHRMDLVAVGGWMESNPVQIQAVISHDDADDPCDAVVEQERAFDLNPLAEAYRRAYGNSSPVTVLLRLWDPVSGSPTGRLIEVVL
jgi:hypothetical protein